MSLAFLVALSKVVLVGRAHQCISYSNKIYGKKQLRRGRVCFDSQIKGSVHHGREGVVLGAWVNSSHCISNQKAENGQVV